MGFSTIRVGWCAGELARNWMATGQEEDGVGEGQGKARVPAGAKAGGEEVQDGALPIQFARGCSGLMHPGSELVQNSP